MRLLLDTHIVCWHFYQSVRLPAEAKRLILEAQVVYVSAASLWEVAIKARLGKIDADPQRIFEAIEPTGFRTLPVLPRHAVMVATLPLYHADPFDRLLIAQAVIEPLRLLTVDPQLRQYSELVIQV